MAGQENLAPKTPVQWAIWFRRVELAACLALIAAFAIAWQPWRGPLIFQSDSWGYLRPAMRATLGGPFEGLYARPIAYPAFLNAVFHFGGLSAVPAAQAFVALVAPLSALAIWRLAAPEKTAPRSAAAEAILGVLMIAAMLSYQPFVGLAHMLMAESIGIPLSMLALMLVLIACVADIGRIAFASAFLSGWLAASSLYVVKPQWGAAWLFLWCALLAALVLRKDYSRLGRAALAAIALMFYAAVIWTPQQQFSRGDEIAQRFGPITLVCNNIDIIEPALSSANTGADPRTLAEARTEMRWVLAQPAGYWPTLSFNGDTCVYRSKVPALLQRALAPDMELSTLAGRLLIAGVAARPLTYAARVGKQIRRAIADPFPALGAQQWRDIPAFTALRQYPEMQRFAFPPAMLTKPEPAPLAVVALPLYQAGQTTLRSTRKLFWAFLIAPSLVCAWSLFRKQGFCDRKTRRRALIWVLVCGTYLASLAVIALVHTFDMTRYREGDFALALVTLFVGVATLLDFALTARKGRS